MHQPKEPVPAAPCGLLRPHKPCLLSRSLWQQPPRVCIRPCSSTCNATPSCGPHMQGVWWPPIPCSGGPKHRPPYFASIQDACTAVAQTRCRIACHNKGTALTGVFPPTAKGGLRWTVCFRSTTDLQLSPPAGTCRSARCPAQQKGHKHGGACLCPPLHLPAMTTNSPMLHEKAGSQDMMAASHCK